MTRRVVRFTLELQLLTLATRPIRAGDLGMTTTTFIHLGRADPPRISPSIPLVQFGSNLVANCAVYAGFTGLSGH